MKKQYLESGKIVTTHGVRGEVRVQPWCDTPGFLTQFACLYLDARGSQARVVERARVHKNIVIVKFEGVEIVEDAAGLRGKTVYIDRADVELEEGECFVQDLIGCTVRDADTGADYGQVYDVRATGANDVYYLRDAAGRERLVPAIADVVLAKDLDAGIIADMKAPDVKIPGLARTADDTLRQHRLAHRREQRRQIDLNHRTIPPADGS